MPIFNIEATNLKCDEQGKATKVFKDVKGKLLKAYVSYSETCALETNITVVTSERERIEFFNNNQDFVVYPRNSIDTGKFVTITFEEGSSRLDHYYNCGSLWIQIDGAGSGAVVNEIRLVFEG